LIELIRGAANDAAAGLLLHQQFADTHQLTVDQSNRLKQPTRLSLKI